MTNIVLPPPQPSRAVRFTTSAAFASLALTLLPFFLVGLLMRCVLAPLNSVFERFTSSKKNKKRARKGAKQSSPAPAAGAQQTPAAAVKAAFPREGSPGVSAYPAAGGAGAGAGSPPRR